MTKEELVERLDWTQAFLLDAITSIQDVLKDGREHLVMDDADWLCFVLEHADDARHALLNRGPLPRLSNVEHG